MLERLAAARRAGDLAATLSLALELWREHRSPDLASLIESIGASGSSIVAPRRGTAIHAWWITHAQPYDPLKVSALVEHARERLGHSDREAAPQPPRKGVVGARELTCALAQITQPGTAVPHANALERLSAILEWPDDPRTAALLVDWLVTAPVRWDPAVHGRATQHFYSAIADKLKVLCDVGGASRLDDCIRAPRGATVGIRDHQRVLARQVREAIDKRARLPAALAARIAKLVAPATETVPHRTRRVDEHALWGDCARHPDDPAPRLVLADYLAERGDSRGELIALQGAGTPAANAAANRLIRSQWAAWLGDLALVLNRNGTSFEGGLLDTIRVGTPKSPEWAFGRVHDHRELATVRTVRPGHVRPEHYARLLASRGLEPACIAIDAPEVLDWLATHQRRWRFRVFEYGHYSVRDAYRSVFPPMTTTFERLAEIAPDLVEIRIAPLQWPHHVEAQVREVTRLLPTLFRKLERIVLDPQWLGIDPSLVKLALVVAG